MFKLMRVLILPMLVGNLPAVTHSLSAGVVFGTDGDLGGGYRWDAAPRTFNGNERSLDGGLRYSLQGGSLQAYRDMFTWDETPTVAQFGTAIDQVFGAWTAVDPATGLGTDLFFVDDTSNTAVVSNGGFGSGVNTLGAEIDLLAADAGDSGTRGEAWFASTTSDVVTLTSGTEQYGRQENGQPSLSGAITGADVYINSNAGAVYDLDLFRRLLTHELGHALGLGDVEDFTNRGFIDDNYDGSSDATALATLTNSWALLVNPLDPSASVGLTQFPAGTVGTLSPGLQTPGVDILMESFGLGIDTGNPVDNLFPLSNDDYGTRQFLYPFLLEEEPIPEPSTWLLLSLTGLTAAVARRANKRRSSLLN